jgi:hypothetical protein
LKVAQLAEGAREAVARTDQANVMPHEVLNGLQIALDEGVIGRLGQARCNLLGGFTGWLQTNPAVSSVLGRGCRPNTLFGSG